MCVIVTKPKDVRWVEKESLRSCWDENPDGAGFAFARDGSLTIKKGYFNFDRLYNDLIQVEALPVLLHFRFATHGSIAAKNCHPFVTAKCCAMAHNGIIPFKSGEYIDMTDSERFCRQYLDSFTIAELEKGVIHDLIERAVDTDKIALLTPKGNFIHFNYDSGVEYEGLWFSNSAFLGYHKWYYNLAAGWDNDFYDVVNYKYYQ